MAFEEVDAAALKAMTMLRVVVDRVKVSGDARTRITDSIETAYAEGGGAAWAVQLPESEGKSVTHQFSERFECRTCGIPYEDPQPRLFSFNNPFGACPTCHGFGNIIELDQELVVPDPAKSINQGAIEPWTKPHYRTHLAELKRAAKTKGLRLDEPWRDLSDDEIKFVMDGDGDDFEGVRGFFRWLERKKYKVHVRVFLSRYRGYLTCPDCNGTRRRRHDRQGVGSHST
jgi:excinuclease ABC subunit A